MSGKTNRGHSYAEAGVNPDEGYRAVSMYAEAARATHGPEVLGGIGGFGSLYALGSYRDPVLVSGTDGVGTKLEIAFATGFLDGIGQDCFAMCANDVLCHGARPLFFLDYLATGKLDAGTAARIVTGIARACAETGTALIGGETAEMPGFYRPGEYDVVGFCVGAVERDRMIVGPDRVREGDTVLGLASSGLHSNGFSLVRRILTDWHEQFRGSPLYEELLTPTRVYVNSVLAAVGRFEINGLAHITGGGLPENLPRAIPDGLQAEIEIARLPGLPVLDLLRDRGVAAEEMRKVFNMGVGFCLIVPPPDARAIADFLTGQGEQVFEIGTVGKGGERLCFV